MRIYVVMEAGSNDYDELYESAICAFSNKEKAKAYIATNEGRTETGIARLLFIEEIPFED